MLRELRHELLSVLILLFLEHEVVLEVLPHLELQVFAEPALLNMLVDDLQLASVGKLLLLQLLENVANV